MEEMQIKKLSEDACNNFDTDYMTPERYAIVYKYIIEKYPSGEFSFLDVGGGNGIFVDRLLKDFPKAEGTLIDNSEILIARNKGNLRKKVILDSFENINQYSEPGTYDLIFCNWVLHHFVANTYTKSKENIQNALREVSKLLKQRGACIVYENLCKGIVSDYISSRLVFFVSASRFLAPIAKKFGSNSAGCGVCYLYEKAWKELVWENKWCTCQMIELNALKLSRCKARCFLLYVSKLSLLGAKV